MLTELLYHSLYPKEWNINMWFICKISLHLHKTLQSICTWCRISSWQIIAEWWPQVTVSVKPLYKDFFFQRIKNFLTRVLKILLTNDWVFNSAIPQNSSNNKKCLSPSDCMSQTIRTLATSTEMTWSPKGCRRCILALWPL